MDARIAGEPMSSNPYLGGDWTERMAFARGWRDADRYWGEEVARRTFRPLPAVQRLPAPADGA